MSETFDKEQKITEIESELASLDRRRIQLLEELNQLQQLSTDPTPPTQISIQLQEYAVHNQSPEEDKIKLFRSLFRGREDVFPRRFESSKTGKSGYSPVCQNEWINGICKKPKVSCQECVSRVFIPVNDEIIRNHLLGNNPQEYGSKDYTIGVFPLLPDETCWFLAIDFDKSTWDKDAIAFLETCKMLQAPASLERSRSGNGGHVWIFFEAPIQASLARRLGTLILTKTMNLRPEIGMDSYDRIFPNQDTMPRGGFGNLIALPLQKKPREKGNSVFINQELIPYEDQWAFLSSIQRMTSKELNHIFNTYDDDHEIIGVRTVVVNETENTPWKLQPSREYIPPRINEPVPEQLKLVVSNQIYIEKEKLSASLRNRIIRLAAFQNPEFYKAQAMRLSTFGKPRIISCCEEYPKHLALPRGCQDELLQVLDDLTIKSEWVDERTNGKPINNVFQGTLREEQQYVANELLKHDIGVLSASTAFGKTVIGTWLIAQRKVNTLIIVHRKQLMDQWENKLQLFLGMDKNKIGKIGGGKNNPNGIIDIAMIQSLSKKGVVNNLIENYGQIIVDECHHISAVSFEQVIRQAKARYIIGLSATVTRQDGHHPIIFMQCGPIRYKVDDRKQTASRSFSHKVIIRKTNFTLPIQSEITSSPAIQEIYAMLTEDAMRNKMIVEDVLAAIHDGRSPVLLTERREHMAYFAETLYGRVKNIFLLSGGMSQKQRNNQMEQLKRVPDDEERLIIATGRYLGEGFDDARLDTLFLALPIAWKGTIAQYAGRLHRDYDQKSEVIIYDYVDERVPILAGMFRKRKKGYIAIGYENIRIFPTI